MTRTPSPESPCNHGPRSGPGDRRAAAVITRASGGFSCSALEALRDAAGGTVAAALTTAEIAMASPAVTQTQSRLPAASACGRSMAVTALATLGPLDDAKTVSLISGGAHWSRVGRPPDPASRNLHSALAV